MARASLIAPQTFGFRGPLESASLIHRFKFLRAVFADEAVHLDAAVFHRVGDGEGALGARATWHEFGAKGEVHAGAGPSSRARAVWRRRRCIRQSTLEYIHASVGPP
jgi:hypothetical protein